ncbi:MAG: hypothetical protein JST47_16285 [Bacteroidetes bacterium]|nr:hypothetical protein [Bacteroidota bacterium]MBS1972715.1 hypothetical protein [Bacteroidota bacterium]
MSTRLEQFIKDNREEFDEDAPSPKVWDNIEQAMAPPKKKGGAVVKMSFMKWAAVAAAAVLAAMGIWFLAGTKTNNIKPETTKEIADAKPIAPSQKTDDTATKIARQADDHSSQQLAATTDDSNKTGKQSNAASELQKDVKDEMAHYAKLVEIKHRELKTLAKEEPLLFQQFSSDVNKLDSVFHSLEIKLSKNQNSEELIEAMIQNLQLQMQLLNKQLSIVKQLNQSKKSAYEKAYQSI